MLEKELKQKELTSVSKANKYLVYHDILLAMANSARYKDSLAEEALLAGAAGLMSRYKREKEKESKDVR